MTSDDEKMLQNVYPLSDVGFGTAEDDSGVERAFLNYVLAFAHPRGPEDQNIVYKRSLYLQARPS